MYEILTINSLSPKELTYLISFLNCYNKLFISAIFSLIFFNLIFSRFITIINNILYLNYLDKPIINIIISLNSNF